MEKLSIVEKERMDALRLLHSTYNSVTVASCKEGPETSDTITTMSYHSTDILATFLLAEFVNWLAQFCLFHLGDEYFLYLFYWGAGDNVGQ